MFNLVCQMKSHFDFSLFLAAGPLLSSCRDDGSAQDPMMMPEPEVTVTTVRGEEIPVTSNLPGRMEAFLQAEVRARVTGIIQERFYQEGQNVKQGDLLFKIEPEPLQAALDECKAALIKGNYFGTMLVKMGKADCLLGGATYSTADSIRPALQLVKTKKGAHLVSSCFILDRDCGEEGLKRIAMGDCAVNIDYTDTVDKATGEVKVSAASKLAEVAVETARTAKLFGIDPKVAVLSFSTKGSGKGGTVALSHDATIKAQEMDPELAVDGELQFDAAVAPEVAQVKCKGSKVAGQANTFIFPCIEAGNIGYKIAQRLGGYAAYGPILQGLNAPINDLSRGCNADEVYKMSLITACQS